MAAGYKGVRAASPDPAGSASALDEDLGDVDAVALCTAPMPISL